MNRSGYTDDIDDNWAHIMWRGRVASAMRGARGQQLLRDLLAALDAMPEKELIAEELECADGVCALGAVGQYRGLDMSKMDPECPETIAPAFNIAEPLVCEIEYVNDEWGNYDETPAQRWMRMRKWVASKIKDANV